MDDITKEVVKVERTAFIDELLKEIDAMDPELFPPPEEVDKAQGEEVVGEMSLYSKKLLAMAWMYGREAERIQVEIKYASDEASKLSLGKVKSIAVEKNNVLIALMYASIRTDLNLYERCHVGVRKGWLVITKPCNHNHSERKGGIQVLGMKDGDLPPGLKELFGL